MAANTLTGLIPTLFAALDVISRELVGFIPAVTRNSSAERAAVGQPVTYPIVPAMSATDITPAAYPSDAAGVVVGTDSLMISKSKKVEFPWQGEEQKALMNSAGVSLQGDNYKNILRDQYAQAMRTLVNLIEVDLASTYKSASRAYGTSGTTPFGTANDFSDFAGALRLLDDNGAPQTDRQLVLGSAAISNVRGKQSILFKANEAGTDELLRRGIIGKVEGFDIHNSAQVVNVTKGTGSGDLVNNGAGYNVGDTAVTLDTGTGTILAGDVVTFAGDSNQYVVGTALGSNVVTLNKPGLRAAEADNTALTVTNNYAANMAFHRSAIHLVTRAPAMPVGPDGKAMDQADDVIEITDPVSGLAFQIAVYRQYRQLKYEVGIAWGWKATKSEHIVILKG